MVTNSHFAVSGYENTQNLYEDLIIEAIQIYGQNMFYIPRETVRIDALFGEDIASRFTESYEVEMYVENTEGYDGQELFQKFGVEIRDDAVFVVARKRWETEVIDNGGEMIQRPQEGDLVYAPFSKSLFEIMFVEHEDAFYQLNQLPVYKLNVKLFEYNDEDIDIDETGFVQDVEQTSSQLLLMDEATEFEVGEDIWQVVGDHTVSGEVTEVSDNQVKVTNVSTTGDEFGVFVSGLEVQGQTTSLTATVIDVTDYNGDFGENDQIKIEADEIIDPDHSNPFGDW